MSVVALPLICCMSAKMVEAEGIRFALGSEICSRDRSYVMEGDAQTVIKMLQGQSPVKAYYYIKYKIKSNYSDTTNFHQSKKGTKSQ